MISEVLNKQTEQDVIEPNKIRITIEGKDMPTQIFEIERHTMHMELRAAHADQKVQGWDALFTLSGRIIN